MSDDADVSDDGNPCTTDQCDPVARDDTLAAQLAGFHGDDVQPTGWRLDEAAEPASVDGDDPPLGGVQVPWPILRAGA